MLCTKCGKTWVPGEAKICSSCTGAAGGAGAPSAAKSDVGLARRMVPTGNKPALIGYYAAVASVIPYGAIRNVPAIVGPVLGAVAVVCGILGLIRVRQHPEARGGGHAWFAIVGGIVLGAIGFALSPMVREAAGSHEGW